MKKYRVTVEVSIAKWEDIIVNAGDEVSAEALALHIANEHADDILDGVLPSLKIVFAGEDDSNG